MKKRLLLVAVSASILILLWRRTGWTELFDTCRKLDLAWFAAALLMFLPQTVLSGARWSWLVETYQPLGLRRGIETVLAASALNVILPSKMGDVAKGAWLDRGRPGGELSLGIALGIFEKGLDTAALGLLMVAATALEPPEDPLGWFLFGAALVGVLAFAVMLLPGIALQLRRRGDTARPGLLGKVERLLGQFGRVIVDLAARPRKLALILASAVLLWGLHLLQFSLALRAAGGVASTAFLWSRVPMAIFVGLLPVTFAGMGTRDAAMVFLLKSRVPEPIGAALGVFATLRYVATALAGLPFMHKLPVRPSAKTAAA